MSAVSVFRQHPHQHIRRYKKIGFDFFRGYGRDLRESTRVPAAFLFNREHPPGRYLGKVLQDEIVLLLSAGAGVRLSRYLRDARRGYRY